MSSQPPHSGYHWDGITPRFFEGWYFRVMIPQLADGFAFMYSIQDPRGGQVNSGGAVQILAIESNYLCRTFPDTDKFWASRQELAIIHWGKTNLKIRPCLLSPSDFFESIREGYQATAHQQQGRIYDPVTGGICQWDYRIETRYSWGDKKRPPQATAGILSYLPIFDPGWQILTAHGLATGMITYGGKNYQFENVPFYSEKNWGYSFPEKWFWINCNAFPENPDLTLTAVGSTRKVLNWTESVGIIGIHWQNRFYKFDIWNSQLTWTVQPWGYWEMRASNENYTIVLIGISDHPPDRVRVPTEKGLCFACQDTLKGKLAIKLADSRGKIIINSSSGLAGLEIGGIWPSAWIKQ